MDDAIRSTTWAIFTLLFLLASSLAFAVTSSGPPTVSAGSASGNFTVTYSGSVTWFLEEKVGEGSWTVLDASAGKSSVQFSGKSNGVYYYRVAQLGMSGSWFISYHYSSEITVIVGNAPELDNLADQANYQFQLRQGDLNGDGRKDLYIKRSSGGNSDSGVLYETLLVQQSDKTYQPASNPTSAQLSSGRSWSLFSPTLVLGDYNVDGYIDLFIKGMSSLGSGINDQLVFSSGQAYNGKAQASTAVDAEFKKFFRDTYNRMLDPNYFDSAIIPQQNGLRVKLLGYVSGYYQWCPSWYCTWIQVSANVRTAYQKDFTSTQLASAIAGGLKVYGNGGSGLNDYVGNWYLGGYCRYLWESEVCYQWVQSNSIVTVDGGFDGENYSERAQNFVNEFDIGDHTSYMALFTTEAGVKVGPSTEISDDVTIGDDTNGAIPGLLQTLILIEKIEIISGILSGISIGVDIITGPSGEAAVIIGVIKTGASKATKKAFQRQLQQHGRTSLERSRRKIQRRLDEHLEKLEKYKNDGGYTSSVETEIRQFKRALEAIDEILGGLWRNT